MSEAYHVVIGVEHAVSDEITGVCVRGGLCQAGGPGLQDVRAPEISELLDTVEVDLNASSSP